jgi:tRNA 2-thiocytidine biosynthesis protein TtcA
MQVKNPTRLHKSLRKCLEKAIQEYSMIEPGDRVLVGVSGGPDSLCLLQLLLERHKYIADNHILIAAHIDLGFKEEGAKNREFLKAHFQSLNVDFRIVETGISLDFLDPGATKNPCFICSHQRRREIYRLANKEKCNKIAYGHHKDNVVETLLINILFGRKIEAMHPVQEVFKGKMHIIRPLLYAEETLLKRFAKEFSLPSLKRLCPMDGNTRRDKVKAIIKDLQATEQYANIKENIFRSLHHVHLSGFQPRKR